MDTRLRVSTARAPTRVCKWMDSIAPHVGTGTCESHTLSLLKNGVDVAARDNYRTPLHVTLAPWHVDLTRLLIVAWGRRRGCPGVLRVDPVVCNLEMGLLQEYVDVAHFSRQVRCGHARQCQTTTGGLHCIGRRKETRVSCMLAL